MDGSREGEHKYRSQRPASMIPIKGLPSVGHGKAALYDRARARAAHRMSRTSWTFEAPGGLKPAAHVRREIAHGYVDAAMFPVRSST